MDPLEVVREGDPPVTAAGGITGYRVEPSESGGEFHILTFENGVEVQIYTDRPLIIVQPEIM